MFGIDIPELKFVATSPYEKGTHMETAWGFVFETSLFVCEHLMNPFIFMLFFRHYPSVIMFSYAWESVEALGFALSVLLKDEGSSPVFTEDTTNAVIGDMFQCCMGVITAYRLLQATANGPDAGFGKWWHNVRCLLPRGIKYSLMPEEWIQWRIVLGCTIYALVRISFMTISNYFGDMYAFWPCLGILLYRIVLDVTAAHFIFTGSTTHWPNKRLLLYGYGYVASVMNLFTGLSFTLPSITENIYDKKVGTTMAFTFVAAIIVWCTVGRFLYFIATPEEKKILERHGRGYGGLKKKIQNQSNLNTPEPPLEDDLAEPAGCSSNEMNEDTQQRRNRRVYSDVTEEEVHVDSE